MKTFNKLIFLFSWILILSCENEPVQKLSVKPEKLEFTNIGGSLKLSIVTNAGHWKIVNPASSWLYVSSTSGTKKIVDVTVIASPTQEERSDTLIITAGNADPVYIPVIQSMYDSLFYINTDIDALSFSSQGGIKSFTISTNAPAWSIESDADWLNFTPTSGSSGENIIEVYASENNETSARYATLSISGNLAPTVQLLVTQAKRLYPNYNTSPQLPDSTGMGSTAQDLALKINLGWNIGNTMEAIGGETSWGNPKITSELIALVKASGFNAVRIPCSWYQYMSDVPTAKIDIDWLNRVQEVVQTCVDLDMYVLLNIHWDGGWLEDNCNPDKQEENNARQQAFWEQIATHLRNFDEHLLFASANEPKVENALQMEVLNSYHQTFIDAVRSTGGRNSYRALVVQGPSTDIDKTYSLMQSLPIDETPDKLMVEVHFYAPFQFCLMTEDASWGNRFFYWGSSYHSTTDTDHNANWGEESYIDETFSLMKTKFIDKGIPVILGEYGALRRLHLTGDNLDLHLASRAYYNKYVTQQALAKGLIPFYWDEGGNNNHSFGIFNRDNNTVFDQLVLDALVNGAR